MRLWPALLLLGGCFANMGYSTLEQVSNAAREYNNDVRWGRYDQAAKHVATSDRQRFIDRHASLEDELEIADYEMTDVQVAKNKKTATARVEYTWSLKTRGIVEKTTTRQSWERHDQDWIVASEVRVKGAPLVLFDEEKRDAPAAAQASASAEPTHK